MLRSSHEVFVMLHSCAYCPCISGRKSARSLPPRPGVPKRRSSIVCLTVASVATRWSPSPHCNPTGSACTAREFGKQSTSGNSRRSKLEVSTTEVSWRTTMLPPFAQGVAAGGVARRGTHCVDTHSVAISRPVSWRPRSARPLRRTSDDGD